MITVRIENIDALKQAFARAPEQFAHAYQESVGRVVKKIEGDAKKKAPVNKESGGGNLRQSIRSGVQGMSGVVVADAKYAAAVNFGSRPHIIRSHGNYPLRNRRTGAIFGREVLHSGNRPQPFFSDAVEENETLLNRELQRAAQTVLNNLFR